MLKKTVGCLPKIFQKQFTGTSSGAGKHKPHTANGGTFLSDNTGKKQAEGKKDSKKEIERKKKKENAKSMRKAKCKNTTQNELVMCVSKNLCI